MNAPSKDMATLLENAGLGVFAASSGWAIYISDEPASPDTVITLYDVPGPDPDYAAGIDYPAVHVRVRGAPHSYFDTYAKATAVRQALIDSNVVSVGGSVYSVQIDIDVGFLEYDESRRPIFTSTYQLMKTEE